MDLLLTVLAQTVRCFTTDHLRDFSLPRFAETGKLFVCVNWVKHFPFSRGRGITTSIICVIYFPPAPSRPRRWGFSFGGHGDLRLRLRVILA